MQTRWGSFLHELCFVLTTSEDSRLEHEEHANQDTVTARLNSDLNQWISLSPGSIFRIHVSSRYTVE